MKNHVRSFQGLRAFAFLGIFLFHCWHPEWSQLAMWGVSFFFILSGFLTGYTLDENRADQPASGWKFMLRRLKKSYGLHIVMILLCFPVSDTLVSLQTEGISKLPFWLVILASNITLTKSLLPKYYFSFNGVSWFLSTYAILCLLTPWIIRRFRPLIRKLSKVQMLLVASVLILLGFLYCFLINKAGLLVEYWTYICPIAHVFDYGLALLAGLWFGYKKPETSLSTGIRSCLQGLVLIGVFVLVFAWSYPEWICRSVLWIMPNLLLVLLFRSDRGIGARVFGSKTALFLGKHSANMFLIHQVLYRYFERYLGTPDSAALLWGFILLVYLLTLGLSLIWDRLAGKKKKTC